MACTVDAAELENPDAAQLRDLTRGLIGEVRFKQAPIDQLTYELTRYKGSGGESDSRVGGR